MVDHLAERSMSIHYLLNRGMSGTATTCPGTSLGIPKYPGHVPGLLYPGMSHAWGAHGS